MTHEERAELYEVLDGRYVLRSECEPQMEDVRRKLANDDKRLAVIQLQVKINNWLTAAIASGIIALVIKTFIGG